MRIPCFWLEPTDDVRVTRFPCNGECGTPDCEGSSRSATVYRRVDTGELMTLGEAPAGAMWDATWFDRNPAYTGPDGIALVVRTPGGTWMVDSRASNCTLPNDDVHKCWIRHGDPRTEPVTVDKNGVTCSAGAGSIQCGTYHGFLRDGALVE